MNGHLLAILFTLLALKAPAQEGAFFTSGTDFLVPNMGIYQARAFRDPFILETGLGGHF